MWYNKGCSFESVFFYQIEIQIKRRIEMKYYNEETNKYYDTLEAYNAAETKMKEEEMKKQKTNKDKQECMEKIVGLIAKINDTKSAFGTLIEEQVAEYNKALEQYVKSYVNTFEDMVEVVENDSLWFARLSPSDAIDWLLDI